jgi:hypothetical protein
VPSLVADAVTFAYLFARWHAGKLLDFCIFRHAAWHVFQFVCPLCSRTVSSFGRTVPSGAVVRPLRREAGRGQQRQVHIRYTSSNGGKQMQDTGDKNVPGKVLELGQMFMGVTATLSLNMYSCTLRRFSRFTTFFVGPAPGGEALLKFAWFWRFLDPQCKVAGKLQALGRGY